jgi:uncharacterized protein (DUF1800 family)
MRHRTKRRPANKHLSAKHRHGRKRHHVKAAKLRRHRLHRPPRHRGSTGPVTLQTPLTEPMVDRLFWRAGFGPTAQDRAAWTGKPLSAAVNWLLSTPAGLSGAPATRDGNPLDPTGDDTDLVLSWIDRMVRSTNPFVERLTFFWHRHWANSRDQVSPPQLLITQNNLLRRYADFGSNPNATFRQMAYDVTVDPSMLRYLTGESNVRGAPNENYARELMELFTLGVHDSGGSPNYTQTDVEQLAKALSGWQINDDNPDAVRSYFTQSRWYNGPKIVFGQFGNFNSTDAVNLVLGRPAHPAFLITELWNEFVVGTPDPVTLTRLISTYAGSGLQLKPLLAAILAHPALFASLDEPNMIKPPVVYVVGAMRALGQTVTDTTAADYLDGMGQVPYFPPNVSGWEGGLSWLNTNTALARFSFVSELLSGTTIADVPGETAAAAYDRAHVAVGRPWLAAGTQNALRSFAQTAPSSGASQRKQRQLALRALMLAGPDAQVM